MIRGFITYMMTDVSDITEDGMVVLSEKSGFGVNLDEERLKRTQIG